MRQPYFTSDGRIVIDNEVYDIDIEACYGRGRYDDVVVIGCKNCIICNNTIMVRADAFSNEGLLCDECKKRLNEVLYGADMRGGDNE